MNHTETRYKDVQWIRLRAVANLVDTVVYLYILQRTRNALDRLVTLIFPMTTAPFIRLKYSTVISSRRFQQQALTA
jgi:hypothetical protein